MFIYVHYAENQELILNPNCASLNFMLHLKHVLSTKGVFEEDGVSDLDLCDGEGSVKGLNKLQAMENIAPLLIHKESYFPVKVPNLNNDVDEITDFQLLLPPEDKMFDKINAKIEKQKKNRRLSAEKHHIGTAKKGGRVTKSRSKTIK